MTVRRVAMALAVATGFAVSSMVAHASAPPSDPEPASSEVAGPGESIAPEDIAAAFPAVDDASRILPVTGDLAEVVYALGFGDHVVATDISATYPDEAQDTPKIGYQRALDAETILAYEPTVVITDDRAGPMEVFEALESAGVDVVTVEYHADLQAPAYKVRALASTLGVPDEGEALVDRFERELATGLETAAGGVDESGRPLVLALYLRGDRVQYAFGRGSGIDAVIAAAGGRDVGTQLGVEDYGELTTEAIIDVAPDYLLVPINGLESVGGLDGLLAVPGIAETPAGADPEHRILQFETQFLYGLGPRTGQLVADLATAIHGQPSP